MASHSLHELALPAKLALPSERKSAGFMQGSAAEIQHLTDRAARGMALGDFGSDMTVADASIANFHNGSVGHWPEVGASFEGFEAEYCSAQISGGSITVRDLARLFAAQQSGKDLAAMAPAVTEVGSFEEDGSGFFAPVDDLLYPMQHAYPAYPAATWPRAIAGDHGFGHTLLATDDLSSPLQLDPFALTTVWAGANADVFGVSTTPSATDCYSCPPLQDPSAVTSVWPSADACTCDMVGHSVPATDKFTYPQGLEPYAATVWAGFAAGACEVYPEMCIL